MLTTKYLQKYEYLRTLKLLREAFGEDTAYERELYGGLDGMNVPTGSIREHRVLVTEDRRGGILAMAHLKLLTAVCEDAASLPVGYILCVATRRDMRHRGLMSALLDRLERELRYEGAAYALLVAVDKSIYRSRGYIYDFRFNESERELLHADEGLSECSAKLLAADTFCPPKYLIPRDPDKSADTDGS